MKHGRRMTARERRLMRVRHKQHGTRARTGKPSRIELRPPPAMRPEGPESARRGRDWSGVSRWGLVVYAHDGTLVAVTGPHEWLALRYDGERWRRVPMPPRRPGRGWRKTRARSWRVVHP